MTSRQQRRAAERKARKLDSKTVLQNSTSNELTISASAPALALSEARLTANRGNAQLSTGPKTESGKATSSKNAIKTALTGRTVLLPTDDAERYEQHLTAYEKAYRPIGERECELVQSLADATWRIDRIPGLEEALYVMGCNRFAGEVMDLDPRARLTMLRMHTYLAYERQFRNLQIQEMRLHRLREKLIKEVAALQQEREQQEKDELERAAKLSTSANHGSALAARNSNVGDSKSGFEFSRVDLAAKTACLSASPERDMISGHDTPSHLSHSGAAL